MVSQLKTKNALYEKFSHLLMNNSESVSLNDGKKIPLLGLGTWQIAGKEAEIAVKWALEAGYRHIDTAFIYDNEENVGAALKGANIPRERLFITTKLWNTQHKNPKAALKASLKRLKLDYVDLYLIHFPTPQRASAWKAMEALQAEGLCRSIGVSNFTVRHLNELIETATVIPAVNQVEFHPFLYQEDLLEFCRQHKIQLAAYSPLTHGRMLSDSRIVALAGNYQKSPAQLLIRWALQHNLIVLPKSGTQRHIIENANVSDFEISQKDMLTLNGLNKNLRVCWDPTNVP
jgi:diketogulonate reductase-like aldo/keto reductase